MRRETGLQKLLDDHLPALAAIPPSRTSWSLRRRTKLPVSAALSFLTPPRTRPTSPAALNSVASDVLSFSVFHAKHRGSQRTTSGSFRSALCFLRLNNPAIRRPATRVPPRVPFGFPICALYFLSPYQTPRILRCAVDTGSHYIGSEGMVSPAYQRK